MHVVCFSKDQGNARAGFEVARALRARGVEVTYGLDPRGWARPALEKDPTFRDAYEAAGGSVDRYDQVAVLLMTAQPPCDALLVTLSASGPPNGELQLVLSQHHRLPVYGLEEVVGGRNNPGWDEGNPTPVQCLRRLFAAFPTAETFDRRIDTVVCVSPPQLERYRGKDWDVMGAEARRKLGIPAESPLIYWTGHPEPENPHAVSRLGEALCALKEKLQAAGAVLVVARHGREVKTPVADNGPAHRHALRLIRDRVGIRVIENSLGYEHLPADHPDAIPAEFRPKELASYQEIVCACRSNGVVVTGFGTDGQIAGYLGVPSILYLDHHGFLLGGLLWREKKLRRLSLPVIPSVGDVEDLHVKIEDVLLDRASRTEHIEALSVAYPFPAKSPAETIVDTILADLGKTG